MRCAPLQRPLALGFMPERKHSRASARWRSRPTGPWALAREPVIICEHRQTSPLLRERRSLGGVQGQLSPSFGRRARSRLLSARWRISRSTTQ